MIVVSSVAYPQGLGEPDDFAKLMISAPRPGRGVGRDELLRRLVEDRYERNDVAFERNRFRVRGDAVDIYAYWRDRAVRVEFFGDEIDAIREFQPVTGVVTKTLRHTVIYPASRYVTTKDKDGARHRGDRARAGCGRTFTEQPDRRWRRDASTSGRGTTSK